MRWVRVMGFVLMTLGTLIVLGYFFDPIAQAWRLFWQLPTPILIGLGVSGLGLLVLFTSLIYERWESRDADRALRDDP